MWGLQTHTIDLISTLCKKRVVDIDRIKYFPSKTNVLSWHHRLCPLVRSRIGGVSHDKMTYVRTYACIYACMLLKINKWLNIMSSKFYSKKHFQNESWYINLDSIINFSYTKYSVHSYTVDVVFTLSYSIGRWDSHSCIHYLWKPNTLTSLWVIPTDKTKSPLKLGLG